MKLRHLCFIAVFLWTLSCQQKTNQEVSVQDSTSVEEFDLAHSDPAAVQLADSVIAAAGGMDAWHQTRFISWSFQEWNFSWDKKTNSVRAESISENSVFLFNAETVEGKGKVNGSEVTDRKELKDALLYLRKAFGESKQILTMPFILKDGGTKLIYDGEVTLEQSGLKCNVLRATFNARDAQHQDSHQCTLLVGLSDNLIKECICGYDGDSSAVIPMDNYVKYDKVLLSDSHSKNIRIEGDLPKNFFSEL